MKRVTALLVLAMFAAGCSDSTMMDDLGDRSHEYVVGSTTSTVFVSSTDVIEASAGVTAVETVRWFNERIQGEEISEANIVVSAVWARGGADGRFVQASPAEMVIAAPGIEFPALLPAAAEWITSQLVFDPASATLDPVTLAAFGVWSVPPYTDDAGRLAVLRVGEVRGAPIVGINSANTVDGLSLAWTAGPYRYDLLCYADVAQDVCWQMAEVMAPLASVSPAPVVESG